MKSTPKILAAILVLSFARGGELMEEIDSAEEAFHHILHGAPEIYLVCYYRVDRKASAKGRDQIDVFATIVDVVKGSKEIGDPIQFSRVSDGRWEDISSLIGSLNYVSYVRTGEKDQMQIDPQDPAAVWQYSQERADAAHQHKQNKSVESTGASG